MANLYNLLSSWRIEVVFASKMLYDDGIKGCLMSPDYREKWAIIEIGGKLDLRERIVTFFHELLHLRLDIDMAPEMREWRIGSSELERELDREADAIYDCQPHLVRYVVARYKLDRDLNPVSTSHVHTQGF